MSLSTSSSRLVNKMEYTILSNGDLLINVTTATDNASIVIPGNLIIEQEVKSKKYSTFMNEYAYQFFSVRNIGAYQVTRVDSDRD